LPYQLWPARGPKQETAAHEIEFRHGGWRLAGTLLWPVAWRSRESRACATTARVRPVGRRLDGTRLRRPRTRGARRTSSSQREPPGTRTLYWAFVSGCRFHTTSGVALTSRSLIRKISGISRPRVAA